MMLNLSKSLALAGMFGSLILMIILAVVALRDGSFLYQSHGNKMVFRKRLTLRTFLAILGLFMGVGGPINLWYRLAEASGPPSSRIVCIALWSIFAALFVATGILIVHFSGPEDLYLDLDQRTYRLVSGWPLFPATRSGNWSDMAGVYVRGFGSGGIIVGISWQYNGNQKIPLGRFEREYSANQFAQEMVTKLELPRFFL